MQNQNTIPLYRRRGALFLFRAGLILLFAGILASCAGLAYLLIARSRPVTLPAPTGPYPVGRSIHGWQDARTDRLAAGEPQPRQMVLWIWYPAAPDSGAKPAPYLPKDWTRARDADMGLGALLRQDPESVRSYAIQDAPLAAEPDTFPVLIFAPGYGPIAADYTVLAEDLASHGYIVAGVTPLESAPVAVMPDGQVFHRTPAGSLPETNGPALVDAGNRLVEIWVSDMRSAWSHLNKLNRDEAMWLGRLDMQHSGFFGHSFGGAAALNTCAETTECLAAADLDGSLFGPVINDGLTKPALFLMSDLTGSQEDQLVQKIYQANPAPSRWLEITGARHFNFVDQAVQFDPLLRFSGLVGSENAAQTLQTIRAELLGFFNRHLKPD